MRLLRTALAVGLAGGPVAHAGAQQRADSGYVFHVSEPAFPPGSGPVVLVDEAHGNFHTLGGRYAPFGAVLAADGFVVRPHRGPFEAGSLEGASVLVIANALHEDNAENWALPTPSAFPESEIAAVADWVAGGGALFLIADHMPFPGAAAALAAAFGVTFNNGFAVDPDDWSPLRFDRESGTLLDTPVTAGRKPSEAVDHVVSFTGQAFTVPGTAVPVLRLPAGFVTLTPEIAWQFDEETPREPVEGWSQGALVRHGRGRVAIFGEAAMFTAQRADGRSTGLAHPGADQNARFLLNILHWLAGPIGG